MITRRQIREARHMLGWSYADTGLQAALPPEAIMQAEIVGDQSVTTLAAVKQAFERAGLRLGRNGTMLRMVQSGEEARSRPRGRQGSSDGVP